MQNASYHLNFPADVAAVEATERLVPIGNTTTFHCNETNRPVWVIETTNDTLITDRKDDRHRLPENRIFPQNDSEFLMVQATVANNNTIIQCRSVFGSSSGSDFILFAKLKVLGAIWEQ